MYETVVFRSRGADSAAHPAGNGIQRVAQVGAQTLREIAGQICKIHSEQGTLEAEKSCSILAGLNHDLIRFTDDEQSAVWLYGSGEMNLLPLAVRQIGLSEFGRCA